PSCLQDVEDTAVQFQLPGRDPLGGAVHFQILSAPSKGTITLDPATGLMQYTPAANQNGADTFVYRVFNAVGWSDATITVNIQPVEDAPTFSTPTPLAGATSESAYAATITGADVDGDHLSVSVVSMPAWLQLVGNG